MILSDRVKLEQAALKIRLGIIRAISSNHGGHIGGSLDLADMLAVVYSDFMRVRPEQPLWDDRDFMIFPRATQAPPSMQRWHGGASFLMSGWII